MNVFIKYSDELKSKPTRVQNSVNPGDQNTGKLKTYDYGSLIQNLVS